MDNLQPSPRVLLVVALPVESYLMKDNESKEDFNSRTKIEDGELEKIVREVNAIGKIYVDIIYTGVGMNNASAFTTVKLCSGSYINQVSWGMSSKKSFTHVISVGSCGARPNSDLKVGDVVIPYEAMNMDLNRSIGPAYNSQPHCPDEKLTIGMNTSSMSRQHDEEATHKLDTEVYNFDNVIEKAKGQNINVVVGGLCGSSNMFDGPPYVNDINDPNLKRVTINEMELAGIKNAVDVYNINSSTKVKCLAIKYVGNIVPSKNTSIDTQDNAGQDWINDLKKGTGQNKMAKVTKLVLEEIGEQYLVKPSKTV